MAIKHRAKDWLNKRLEPRGYRIVESAQLYDWQKGTPPRGTPEAAEIPEQSAAYLSFDNPKLRDLQERYRAFERAVCEPLVWTDDRLSENDLRCFRGETPYVWQLRGPNMNEMAYVLTYYYLKRRDTLGLLDRLQADQAFGNTTFHVDKRPVSRDLLDSVNEILFLERQLQVVSGTCGLTVLDIGAGYGRLAYRMVCACPRLRRYLCTDAVAASTFISEHYLAFRGIADRATVVPLDEIEQTLAQVQVDLAVNIHSFSECRIPAIDWWIRLLSKRGVRYLMVAPNGLEDDGATLRTNEGAEFQSVIETYGYTAIAREPKFADPLVQKYGINPTHYTLFRLSENSP